MKKGFLKTQKVQTIKKRLMSLAKKKPTASFHQKIAQIECVCVGGKQVTNWSKFGNTYNQVEERYILKIYFKKITHTNQ